MRELLALIGPGAAGLTLCLGLVGVAGHHHVHGTAHAALLAVSVGLGVLVTAAIVGSLARGLTQHRRLVATLRRTTQPALRHQIAVREGRLGEVAFVAGLVRPTIFVDPALLDALPRAQQRAVLLHERAHQCARDPWRSQLDLAVHRLARLVGRTASVERRLARREIAADRWALRAGASRRALAGALLATAPGRHVGVAAFPPAAELRVRALLGEPVEVHRRPAASTVGLGLGSLAVAACALWWHPSLGW